MMTNIDSNQRPGVNVTWDIRAPRVKVGHAHAQGTQEYSCLYVTT